MANEPNKTQTPQTDERKKTNPEIEPLSDKSLDDVSGGICSVNICSSEVA
ncbi:MAG: hypothetical protein JWM83_1928 [Candidatus Angelobacter sp.]|nr:hypothetical protein [Candidatus Angelobacter sp.]